jgi:hypothetical protein
MLQKPRDIIFQIDLTQPAFGTLKVLREELVPDFGKHFLYLVAITIGRTTFHDPDTSLLSDYLACEDEDPSIFAVRTTGTLLIHANTLTNKQRLALIDSAGQTAWGHLRFRKNGESPELLEGADYEWLGHFNFVVPEIRIVAE